MYNEQLRIPKGIVLAAVIGLTLWLLFFVLLDKACGQTEGDRCDTTKVLLLKPINIEVKVPIHPFYGMTRDGYAELNLLSFVEVWRVDSLSAPINTTSWLYYDSNRTTRFYSLDWKKEIKEFDGIWLIGFDKIDTVRFQEPKRIWVPSVVWDSTSTFLDSLRIIWDKK